MCLFTTSVLILKPGSCTTIRHHGEQEAIIYAVSGKGALLTQPRGEGSNNSSNSKTKTSDVNDSSNPDDADDEEEDDEEEDNEEEEQPERHDLSAGDFALIPAWTEHQLVNDSADEEADDDDNKVPVDEAVKAWAGDDGIDDGEACRGTPANGDRSSSQGEDFHLVIIRSGGQPVEVHLTDWGGPEIKS
ncbi:hypothetical protein VTJ49DRAFT_6384 [Mycothermus thermophilus]|uniref:Cupin 2 conserved barrel domain-containing protein n=1 Tax=Humicola insolens TaxID=85995 RepID=A0ABR3VQ95_HUMIN